MTKKVTELGRLFGRADIERCDLFADLGFLDWEKYTGNFYILNESSRKGRQMYSSVPSGGHKKCGLQGASGYFDKKFQSIFVNDPYSEKWKTKGRPSEHPLNGSWIPSGPSKYHSTPGDYYGTFTKASDMPAFSPLSRSIKRQGNELKNFLTNPGKKGNSGYVNICINKYPPHSVNNKTDAFTTAELLHSKNWKNHKEKFLNGPFKAGFFPRDFDSNPYGDPREGKPKPTYRTPTKKESDKKGDNIFYPPAGPKDIGRFPEGCFNKFTSWTPEPYKTQRDVEREFTKKKSDPDNIFRPEPRLKSYYTVSVFNL
ncbi:conserved hypothetical protein [Pediculus humanus corporis]|uniref:Cilia-and flagella-associated protein 96 n=1 Tax=Pediculus humanus subsp. corporis TaxID=121224 RepID=E0VER8_PEDHC|nr:uncharacterized protein Phum_PHUM137840 [Pediculus humanus corporis]EEB11874.1 conserved hypothetical protein [Pediculus humanus corporis]